MPQPSDSSARLRQRLALVMAVGHEARTKHGPSIRKAAGERADAHRKDVLALAARMAEHPHAIDPADAADLQEAADLQAHHERIALGDA